MENKYKTYFIVVIFLLLILFSVYVTKRYYEQRYIPYRNVNMQPLLSGGISTEFWSENKIWVDIFRINYKGDDYSNTDYNGLISFYACEQEFDKKKHYEESDGNEFLVTRTTYNGESYPVRECIVEKGETDNFVDCKCYYATEIKEN